MSSSGAGTSAANMEGEVHPPLELYFYSFIILQSQISYWDFMEKTNRKQHICEVEGEGFMSYI